jgi:hypothetical protein
MRDKLDLVFSQCSVAYLVRPNEARRACTASRGDLLPASGAATLALAAETAVRLARYFDFEGRNCFA